MYLSKQMSSISLTTSTGRRASAYFQELPQIVLVTINSEINHMIPCLSFCNPTFSVCQSQFNLANITMEKIKMLAAGDIQQLVQIHLTSHWMTPEKIKQCFLWSNAILFSLLFVSEKSMCVLQESVNCFSVCYVVGPVFFHFFRMKRAICPRS